MCETYRLSFYIIQKVQNRGIEEYSPQSRYQKRLNKKFNIEWQKVSSFNSTQHKQSMKKQDFRVNLIHHWMSGSVAMAPSQSHHHHHQWHKISIHVRSVMCENLWFVTKKKKKFIKYDLMALFKWCEVLKNVIEMEKESMFYWNVNVMFSSLFFSLLFFSTSTSSLPSFSFFLSIGNSWL